MSTMIEVRQSDSEYLAAERDRRGAEADRAYKDQRDAYDRYTAAQDANYRLRTIAQDLGLNPREGDLGVVEEHLWQIRMDAWREYQYLLSVYESKDHLARQARQAWWAHYDSVRGY